LAVHPHEFSRSYVLTSWAADALEMAELFEQMLELTPMTNGFIIRNHGWPH